MSAITGIGDSTTIVLSASMSFSRGTATRTMSAPASATRRIWSIVACRLAVSVLVMVWTTTGAPPDLVHRRLQVGGLRLGHGLDHDRRSAADLDATDGH